MTKSLSEPVTKSLSDDMRPAPALTQPSWADTLAPPLRAVK